MTLGPLNEFQLMLIGVGAVAVFGVWGYNAWQERKHRQLAQRVFGNAQSDVLMQQETPERMGRIEQIAPAIAPMIDAVATIPVETPAAFASAQDAETITIANEPVVPVASAPVPALRNPLLPGGMQERIEPVFIAEEAVVSAEIPVAMAETSEPSWRARPEMSAEAVSIVPIVPIAKDDAAALEEYPESEPPIELADSLIDCIVSFSAANLVSAPLFWSAQRQLLGRLAGRLRWSGLDEDKGQWQAIHAHDATSYRRFVAALQIADRSGPINATDLVLFCNGMRQLAAHYQAEAIVPVEADVLARAKSLDDFCASVDWRLGINLVHPDGLGLNLTGIRQLADSAGLQLADNGVFLAKDEAGRLQFTLSALGATPFDFDETGGPTAPGVTLTIDVPLVTDGCAAFDRVLNIARLMVVAMEMTIVDDQRNRLSDDVLGVIRTKIGEFQRKMAAHEIPAGDRRALRLYS